jgi:excisionase family DNA binding protein
VAIQEELDLWGSRPARVLLTIKQTAQILSLSRSTIYELIGGGVREVAPVGRSARVPADAVVGFVARLRESGTICQAHREPTTSNLWPRVVTAPAALFGSCLPSGTRSADPPSIAQIDGQPEPRAPPNDTEPPDGRQGLPLVHCAVRPYASTPSLRLPG